MKKGLYIQLSTWWGPGFVQRLQNEWHRMDCLRNIKEYRISKLAFSYSSKILKLQ